jgi:tetratricopeptide (TPR) repeat protein
VEFLKNACDHAIMLQELTLEEGVEFLKQFGLRDLPEEMLQEIIKKIGSNPFVLKHFIGLIQRHWYSPQELIQELPRYKEEIEKCIIEKLFADVSIEEKNLLFLLSLLRKPVNNKLSKCIYKLSDFEEKLYSLLKFFVFIEYENEYYKVHPLTKRISLLQNRDIKRIHQYIAECFDKQINANNKKNDINMYLERHYHYFESGATNEAFKGIYDNLYELINAGYLKTIEQLLSKYTPTILKPENWVNLWQCKGIIAETRGDFETAEKYYKEMFQYADKILFHQGKIDALILLGKNASLKGDILHAKEFLIKSAQLAEKIDYKDKLAEVYHQIAEYCSKMGDMEDAKKWNEKAIQISNKKDKEGKEWIL